MMYSQKNRNKKVVSDELATIFTQVSSLAAKVYVEKEFSLENSTAASLMHVATILNKMRIAFNGNMPVAQNEIKRELNFALAAINEVIA